MSAGASTGEGVRIPASLKRDLNAAATAATTALNDTPDWYRQRIIEGWGLAARTTSDQPVAWQGDAGEGIDAAIIGWSLMRHAIRLLGSFVDRHPLAQLADAVAIDWHVNAATEIVACELGDLLAVAANPQAALVHALEDILAATDSGTMSVFGIGYTTQRVVQPMLGMTVTALQRSHPDLRGLDDERVDIIDPAVGAGPFLVGVIEGDWIADDQIARVYGETGCCSRLIGCEIMCWSHLIGELNIEHAYRRRVGRLDDPTDLRFRLWLGDTLNAECYQSACCGVTALIDRRHRARRTAPAQASLL